MKLFLVRLWIQLVYLSLKYQNGKLVLKELNIYLEIGQEQIALEFLNTLRVSVV